MLFSSRTATEDGRLQEHLAGWRRLLAGLRDDTLDMQAVADLDLSNSLVAEIAS